MENFDLKLNDDIINEIDSILGHRQLLFPVPGARDMLTRNIDEEMSSIRGIKDLESAMLKALDAKNGGPDEAATHQWDELCLKECHKTRSMDYLKKLYYLTPEEGESRARTLEKWNDKCMEARGRVKTARQAENLYKITPPGSTSRAETAKDWLDLANTKDEVERLYNQVPIASPVRLPAKEKLEAFYLEELQYSDDISALAKLHASAPKNGRAEVEIMRKMYNVYEASRDSQQS